MKKLLENKYFPFVIVGLGFFICMSTVELMTYADDVLFSTALQKPLDVFPYLAERYMTWTSRLSIEFFMTLIMRENLWIWRILNTGFFVLLVFGIYRIITLNFKETNYKIRILLIFGITLALFLADLRTMKWGTFWVTGSFNYLWPVSLMVLTLYVPFKLFYGVDSPKLYALLYLPYIIYFGLHEQVVLVFLSFLIISIIVYYVRSRKISYTSLWLLLPTLVCLFLIIICPGNAVRFKNEIATWYPAFADMTLIEKAFYGLNYTVFDNFLFKNYAVVVFLCMLIIYFLFKYKKPVYLKILAFLPPAYITIGVIFKYIDRDGFNLSPLYNFLAIADEKLLGVPPDIIPHSSFFIGIFMVLFFPFIFYKIFGKSIFFLECFLLFGASLMSSFVVSFSPTIFGSGQRIFFVGNVMLVILVIRLVMKLLTSAKGYDTACQTH